MLRNHNSNTTTYLSALAVSIVSTSVAADSVDNGVYRANDVGPATIDPASRVPSCGSAGDKVLRKYAKLEIRLKATSVKVNQSAWSLDQRASLSEFHRPTLDGEFWVHVWLLSDEKKRQGVLIVSKRSRGSESQLECRTARTLDVKFIGS